VATAIFYDVEFLVQAVHKATLDAACKTKLFQNPNDTVRTEEMGMKFLAIVLTLGSLLMPVVAQQNFHPTAKKSETKKSEVKESAEPSTNCSVAAHAHRFDDMRLALVEITSDDACGFSFVNLEENTTGLDNHFQYSDNFIVARAASYKPDAQLIRSDVLTRKSIHHGTRGIAIYCSACKAIMMLKITNE
jgi:hypothetical protein